MLKLKKNVILWHLFIFPIFYPINGICQPSVISANGFSCNSERIPNSINPIVTCRGIFPDAPQTEVQATGFSTVLIRTFSTKDLPQGVAYIFDSSNGCLYKINYAQKTKAVEVNCVSRKGETKFFGVPDLNNYVKWCDQSIY